MQVRKPTESKPSLQSATWSPWKADNITSQKAYTYPILHSSFTISNAPSYTLMIVANANDFSSEPMPTSSSGFR